MSMCVVWNTSGILAHWHANNRVVETRDRDKSLVIRSVCHYGKESRRYENVQTFILQKYLCLEPKHVYIAELFVLS